MLHKTICYCDIAFCNQIDAVRSPVGIDAHGAHGVHTSIHFDKRMIDIDVQCKGAADAVMQWYGIDIVTGTCIDATARHTAYKFVGGRSPGDGCLFARRLVAPDNQSDGICTVGCHLQCDSVGATGHMGQLMPELVPRHVFGVHHGPRYEGCTFWGDSVGQIACRIKREHTRQCHRPLPSGRTTRLFDTLFLTPANHDAPPLFIGEALRRIKTHTVVDAIAFGRCKRPPVELTTHVYDPTHREW